MSVLRLVARSNKETIETLEWMLQEARRGKLYDLVSAFRGPDGKEHHAITGAYRADDTKALLAVLRLKNKITDSGLDDWTYG